MTLLKDLSPELLAQLPFDIDMPAASGSSRTGMSRATAELLMMQKAKSCTTTLRQGQPNVWPEKQFLRDCMDIEINQFRFISVMGMDAKGDDTLLSWAISQEPPKLDIIKELLSKGMDPNAKAHGLTPLMLLCDRRRWPLVDHGVPYELSSRPGSLPKIYSACGERYVATQFVVTRFEALKALLTAGARWDLSEDKTGMHALDFLIEEIHLEVKDDSVLYSFVSRNTHLAHVSEDNFLISIARLLKQVDGATWLHEKNRALWPSFQALGRLKAVGSVRESDEPQSYVLLQGVRARP